MIATYPVTATERKVAEMLLENTGTHMLDSGFGRGRAWQRMRDQFGIGDNETPDYDDIVRRLRTGMTASIDNYGSLRINSFFFLVKNLDYDDALNKIWYRFGAVANYGKDKYDKEWGYSQVPLFLEQLAKRGTVSGLYGDGEPLHENTYNGENALSDVLQYTYFTFENNRSNEIIPDDTYVMLQIHRGADVRGGYTYPALFRVHDESFFSYNDAGISCQEHDVLPDGIAEGQINLDGEIVHAKQVQHSWYTDDGNHWYANDAEGDLVFDDYEDGAPKLHAVKDEESGDWLCPIDGTKLEVYA